MKTNHKDIDTIINTINEAIQLSEDKYLNTRSFMLISCYFLWKMKKESKIKTPGDIERSLTSRNECKFGQSQISDLCCFFTDNPDKWEKFISLKNTFSEEDLANCITNYKPSENDIHKIPTGIGMLIDKLLDINAGDKVLEINCGEAEYMLDSRGRNPNTKYVGFDDAYYAQQIGFLIADVKGYSSMTFENDFYTDGYSKVLANSFYESEGTLPNREVNDRLRELWPDFPAKASEAWKDCGVAIKSITKSGKAVAIVTGGQLTHKTSIHARKVMCDNRYIEGIIRLPDKVYESTWVNPYIIILGHGNKNIKFLDASSYFTPDRIKGKRLNVLSDEMVSLIMKKYNNKKEVSIVSLKEISENDYNLSPARYIKRSKEKVHSIELDKYIKSIKRGMTISASEMDKLISDEPEGMKCILPSSITNGVIDSKLYYNGVIKNNCKNIASYNDILISKTGNPFRIAKADDSYLCVGNTYILSLNTDEISPEYVKCYLSSKQGQEELTRYASGSGTLMITVENLSKIHIPIYDEKKQKELNRKSKEIIADLEKYYKQLADTKEEIDSLFE